MIQWIVGALLSPLTKLGERYLDNQKDKQRLEHGTTQAAIKADEAVRKIKLTDAILKLPLFVGEASIILYISAIMVDSTFPSDYLNPLQLPGWFEPYFKIAVASVFGVSAVQYVTKNWNRP